MKNIFFAIMILLAAAGIVTAQQKPLESSGEQLFTENCNRCHPGGANVINPA